MSCRSSMSEHGGSDLGTESALLSTMDGMGHMHNTDGDGSPGAGWADRYRTSERCTM
jgi:hypothetical protein